MQETDIKIFVLVNRRTGKLVRVVPLSYVKK